MARNEIKTVGTADVATLATSCLLVSLNISVYNGRKKDKNSELDLQEAKGAGSRRAHSVAKHLFAECAALDAISAHAAATRQWFNSVTRPWDDGGRRITTTATWFEISQELGQRRQEFDRLVNVFLSQLSQEISKQAFALGSAFNKSEYPTADELRYKFAFNTPTEPMPLSGDFRVDINEETVRQMKADYDALAVQRVSNAMRESYETVFDKVTHIHERMKACIEFEPGAEEEVTEDEDGNKKVRIVKKRMPKIYQSMVDGTLEMCEVLRTLNFTNDPALEDARRKLERAILDVDVPTLKKSPEMQESLKVKMQDILDSLPTFGD